MKNGRKNLENLSFKFSKIVFNKVLNVNFIPGSYKFISKNIKELSYISMYDVKKIKSLYSNLDTISFWSINNEIKLLEERGYSTKQMETKLHRSFAFPFFLLAMVLLSGVFTLGIRFKENNLTYIFITIITCVLIYFFNDFSWILDFSQGFPCCFLVSTP